MLPLDHNLAYNRAYELEMRRLMRGYKIYSIPVNDNLEA